MRIWEQQICNPLVHEYCVWLKFIHAEPQSIRFLVRSFLFVYRDYVQCDSVKEVTVWFAFKEKKRVLLTGRNRKGKATVAGNPFSSCCVLCAEREIPSPDLWL